MARIYDWEKFLTAEERSELTHLDGLVCEARNDLAVFQADRRSIRRKCVQRARNALNSRLRAEHREKTS